MDSKSEAVGEYSIQRTSSRRFNRLLVSVGVPSRRCSRRRRLAVLLTYGSDCGSSARRRKTAGVAGVAAKISASCAGTNSRRSESTTPFYLEQDINHRERRGFTN